MMEKFRDTSLSFEERAADLVSRMTLEEKITWCGAWTAPIPSLGIPAHHFANEASHGINALNYFTDNRYNVTSYPTCLAMGQSWDREKISQVTAQISDEIRAAHNISGESLSFWCPTINLSKDPRNGRSDENFGEDPFLGGKMAAAYIRGFQGDDEKYVKAAATPKHFMLNSSENNRNTGISFADEKTQREYYARVFEYAFREGKAESVMISYNRINGVPAAVNPFVMTTLLREEWGFDGYVTSDCGAVAQCYVQPMITMMQGNTKMPLAHYYFNDMDEASAASLIEGCDLSCGNEHLTNLKSAYDRGLITEDQIDHAVVRNVTSLFRQGLFDPKGSTPWDGLGAESLNSKAHADLATEMANDTIVLLKNEKNLLPIKTEGLKKILVVGPNANYRELGGYSAGQGGLFSNLDTTVDYMALDGIRDAVAGTGIQVEYEKGWCAQKEYGGGIMDMMEAVPGVDVGDMLNSMMGVQKSASADHADMPEFIPHKDRPDPDRKADNAVLQARALEKAKDADLVIFVAGTDNCTASEGSDRQSIALPSGQGEFLEKMLEVNPNTVTVLVVMGTIGDPALDKAHTLLCATYAGQSQGAAIANVLFGKVNPNGKLTATWYKDDSQLPQINDYGIRKADVLTQDHGRTYWYFDEEPRFPFGYGLHYTTFAYSNLKLSQKEIQAGGTLKVSVDVTNTGSMAGKEIVQLYISRVVEGEIPGAHRPIKQLKGFEKVEIQPGQTKTVTIEVPLKDVTFWSNFYKKMVIEEGTYQVCVGPDSANLPCQDTFTVVGKWDAELATVYADQDKTVYTPGQTGRLKVVATLEDTTRLCLQKNKPVFTSSNPAVAAVDSDGIITAKASGTALITAAVTYNGKTVKASRPVAVK